jgi:hypothetical protein
MERKPRRGADGQTHSKPGSIDQQLEDSFPTSDPPSFSPGAVGAPEDRKTKPAKGDSRAVKAAEEKVKRGEAKKPETY